MTKVTKKNVGKGKRTVTKKATAKSGGFNLPINASMENKLAAKAKELGVRGGAKGYASKLIKEAI